MKWNGEGNSFHPPVHGYRYAKTATEIAWSPREDQLVSRFDQKNAMVKQSSRYFSERRRAQGSTRHPILRFTAVGNWLIHTCYFR
jgi:hypothetical protein